MTVSVKQIASVMREFGKRTGNLEWEKAAKLQDLWFNFNRHVASPVAPEIFDFTLTAWPGQTGITIDWLLGAKVDSNGRVKTAFGMLQALVLEEEGEVRPKIKEQVNRTFEGTAENSVELGALKWSPGMDLKAFHTQRVAFNSVVSDPLTTPLDPLYGALGSFNFYAIPVGRARKLADGSVKVEISDFVFYVLDSFDFVGTQLLGFFKLPDQISKTPINGGTLIANADYNAWRAGAEAKSKGGDFLVITDLRTVHLPVSFTFMSLPSINGTWASSDPKRRFALAIKSDLVEWTETGPETGIVYKKTLPITRQGNSWRIERPNNDVAVLKMLGFQDTILQQAILNHGAHPSFLVVRLQDSGLAAKWSGIKVQKTPQGAFKNLIQPEDPANLPADYTLSRV